MEISKHELRLLEQILSMREMSLIQTLPRILERFYDEDSIHATKDYIYVTGDIPITLIAHLDTVHPVPPKNIYHDVKKQILWSPEGLGADDRAGVFSIINIVNDGYRPSIIFTTKEETGGHGAFALTKDYPNPLVPTNFLVELDRQGTDDAVYYDCGNREFERFISSFGFVTDIGSFSDIAIIGFEWDIAAVNLSIGYFNEHTKAEYLCYYDMMHTIQRVQYILENHDVGPFSYDMITYNQNFNYPVDDIDVSGMNFAKYFKCDCCDCYFPVNEKVRCVDDNTDEEWELCPTCASMHTDKCVKCGELLLNPLHRVKDIKCSICEMGDRHDSKRKASNH